MKGIELMNRIDRLYVYGLSTLELFTETTPVPLPLSSHTETKKKKKSIGVETDTSPSSKRGVANGDIRAATMTEHTPFRDAASSVPTRRARIGRMLDEWEPMREKMGTTVEEVSQYPYFLSDAKKYVEEGGELMSQLHKLCHSLGSSAQLSTFSSSDPPPSTMGLERSLEQAQRHYLRMNEPALEKKLSMERKEEMTMNGRSFAWTGPKRDRVHPTTDGRKHQSVQLLKLLLSTSGQLCGILDQHHRLVTQCGQKTDDLRAKFMAGLLALYRRTMMGAERGLKRIADNQLLEEHDLEARGIAESAEWAASVRQPLAELRSWWRHTLEYQEAIVILVEYALHHPLPSHDLHVCLSDRTAVQTAHARMRQLIRDGKLMLVSLTQRHETETSPTGAWNSIRKHHRMRSRSSSAHDRKQKEDPAAETETIGSEQLQHKLDEWLVCVSPIYKLFAAVRLQFRMDISKSETEAAMHLTRLGALRKQLALLERRWSDTITHDITDRHLSSSSSSPSRHHLLEPMMSLTSRLAGDSKVPSSRFVVGSDRMQSSIRLQSQKRETEFEYERCRDRHQRARDARGALRVVERASTISCRGLLPERLAAAEREAWRRRDDLRRRYVKERQEAQHLFQLKRANFLRDQREANVRLFLELREERVRSLESWWGSTIEGWEKSDSKTVRVACEYITALSRELIHLSRAKNDIHLFFHDVHSHFDRWIRARAEWHLHEFARHFFDSVTRILDDPTFFQSIDSHGNLVPPPDSLDHPSHEEPEPAQEEEEPPREYYDENREDEEEEEYQEENHASSTRYEDRSRWKDYRDEGEEDESTEKRQEEPYEEEEYKYSSSSAWRRDRNDQDTQSLYDSEYLP